MILFRKWVPLAPGLEDLMRSIYDNPYKYACVCNVPFELAKIACLKQRHLNKMQQKHPMRCPHCNSKSLIFEMGSYEEGYGDFIECDDCGDTFDCAEVPNAEYANLTGWEDFDPVLYFSTTANKAEGWRAACGAETLEEWHEYARKNIIGKRSHN